MELKYLILFLSMSSYVICDQSETIENILRKLAENNGALKNLDSSVMDHKRRENPAIHGAPSVEQAREKKDNPETILHLRTQSQMIQDLVNEVRDIKKAIYFLAASAVHRHEIPYISNCNGMNDLTSCLLPRLNRLYTDVSVPVRVMAQNGRPGYGRVEVFQDGDWTTVCSEGWNYDDAKVACRMLGYRDGYTLDSMFVERGNGVQKMSRVQCNGDEDSILDCPFEEPSYDCGHHKDAGVICKV